MRILHLPTEIAGQVGLTAKIQRHLGYEAHNISYPHIFGYPIDITLKKFSVPLLNNIDKIKVFIQIAEFYDVYHYHFAGSLLPKMLDVNYLKMRGKRILTEFWGSDVRLPTVEKERNPYYINSYNESEIANRKKMAIWAEMTGGEAICACHTFKIFLEQYFDKIHFIRQRVDLSSYYPSYPNPETRRIKILHAPSQQAFKGSNYLQKAVENLKRKGLDFEYIEVNGLPYRDALKLYQTADLIVDQLRAGAHGVFACEAMALGKPVICYILPEEIIGYPKDFPIINANPDTIEQVLEECILSPEKLYDIGIKSRLYVERVHNAEKIARDLIHIYKKEYDFGKEKVIYW